MKLRKLFGKKVIEQRIKEVSSQIQKEYRGKDLVILMVLKGSLCFVADLIRTFEIPFELQTIQCSSYGSQGKKRGDLQIYGEDLLLIQNRDVLIVDDIFDSGQTLTVLQKRLEKHSPHSIKTCTLLVKDLPSRLQRTQPDYTLFTIPDVFVVGYGLDYKELYRGLPSLYTLQEDTP